jgi:hypothetical protein
MQAGPSGVEEEMGNIQQVTNLLEHLCTPNNA